MVKTNKNAMLIAIDKSMQVAPNFQTLPTKEGKKLINYTLYWSIMLLLAVPFACLYSGEGLDVFHNLYVILTSPSNYVTDYFKLGSLGSAFLNASLCGFFCNIAIYLTKAKPSATLLAGYFLVIAHCFYGLNLINMLPPFFGILIYCLVFKVKFGDVLHLGFFATSLGPFISDFLFRYTIQDKFILGQPQVTVLGVCLALLFGLIAGFAIPALLPGTTKMHRGYNLFKAGLAIGLFGILAHAFFYKTLGISSPESVTTQGKNDGEEYIAFSNIFYIVVFGLSILMGFLDNNRSFKGYKQLWQCDGWKDDFPQKFGMPLTTINIGIYGMFILAYFNIVFLLTNGVGYTGPAVGVTIAAITFSASGQTPKNVWPIAIGYALVYLLTMAICTIFKIEHIWTLTTQAYINGFAFATGLCPFTGRYGRKYGVIAGAIHAILCTSTIAMHGGFVLYNGGLTSGFTALILLPILDFYHIKPKTPENELI